MKPSEPSDEYELDAFYPDTLDPEEGETAQGALERMLEGIPRCRR